MKWRDATMIEALTWAVGKSVVGPADASKRPFPDWDAVELSDGSVVACLSGGYESGTEYTPEFTAEPPQWQIGVPQ